MLESDEVVAITLRVGAGVPPIPVTTTIDHFTTKLEWDEWYAVVISDRFIIVGRIEESLS